MSADASGLRWSGVGLTYTGPPPVDALLSTDLAIGSGEYVAITGPSGSGKSTLLNILGLLDLSTTGTYTIDGVDVAGLNDPERAAARADTFGFIFQRFHLLPYLTADENVELALMYAGVSRSDRSERAASALERVGLADRSTHLPAAMSGGEQQRVAIARAIVRDQRYLLADEPTGNLDSRTAQTILELLEGLVADGRSVVCVTHSETIAGRAARRLDVLDGNVVERT